MTTKKTQPTRRTPRTRSRAARLKDTITTIVAFREPEDIGGVLITRYELLRAEPAGIDKQGRAWFVLTLLPKK